MEQNKNVMAWVIGILIVVVVIGGIILFMKSPATETPTGTATTTQATTTEPTPTEDRSTGSINSGTSAGAATISYQQALALYGEKRIQLSVTPNGACTATPNTVTYKTGTKIMLDNRSAKTYNVRVGSNITIAPWSFKIVNLSSATLPATWLIDCGTSQNIATILIQK